MQAKVALFTVCVREAYLETRKNSCGSRVNASQNVVWDMQKSNCKSCLVSFVTHTLHFESGAERATENTFLPL